MDKIFTDNSENNNMTDLFRTYQKSESVEIRNKILLHYSYIANTVAVQMRGTTSNFAQVEDMVNHGIITLIDCIDRFDIDKSVKFETYAFLRVRGSMIDFVRKQDWVPRRVRKLSKDIKSSYDKLSTELLREPTDDEMAKELKLSVDKLTDNYREVSKGLTISFENLLEDNLSSKNQIDRNIISPEGNILELELKEQIKNAIDKLNEKEKFFISLYYYENLKLREIAEVLEVSESRVCQIHSKVILKLNTILKDYMRD
ncbi:MAG: sigma-70 family RNA polymerase sigma factor [Oscillospiraceae bacterium]